MQRGSHKARKEKEERKQMRNPRKNRFFISRNSFETVRSITSKNARSRPVQCISTKNCHGTAGKMLLIPFFELFFHSPPRSRLFPRLHFTLSLMHVLSLCRCNATATIWLGTSNLLPASNIPLNFSPMHNNAKNENSKLMAIILPHNKNLQIQK